MSEKSPARSRYRTEGFISVSQPEDFLRGMADWKSWVTTETPFTLRIIPHEDGMNPEQHEITPQNPQEAHDIAEGILERLGKGTYHIEVCFHPQEKTT